jgi:hypothetical protein
MSPRSGRRPLNRIHDPGVPTRADAADDAGTVIGYSGAVLVEIGPSTVPCRAWKRLLFDVITYTLGPRADIAQW